MVLVPGLDRLDGSAIDGMSDELWSQHTAEVLAQKAEDAPHNEHCQRYADGTDLSTAAMRAFVESALPLAVIWDSDGTVVASEQVICMASNALLTARGMPTLGDDELKAVRFGSVPEAAEAASTHRTTRCYAIRAIELAE